MQESLLNFVRFLNDLPPYIYTFVESDADMLYGMKSILKKSFK